MKKIIIATLFFLLCIGNVYAAGSSGGDGGSKSNYDKAVTLIKAAKKQEKKGKENKAISKYEKA